jgi:hypothetical protein
MIYVMPPRRGRGGRPSLGPRERMITALSVDEAETIRDMGDAAKCTYSDLLAGLIRIGLNHQDELPPKLLPKEELDLAESA